MRDIITNVPRCSCDRFCNDATTAGPMYQRCSGIGVIHEGVSGGVQSSQTATATWRKYSASVSSKSAKLKVPSGQRAVAVGSAETVVAVSCRSGCCGMSVVEIPWYIGIGGWRPFAVVPYNAAEVGSFGRNPCIERGRASQGWPAVQMCDPVN